MVSKNNPAIQPESQTSNPDSQEIDQPAMLTENQDNDINIPKKAAQPESSIEKSNNAGRFFWKTIIFMINIILILLITGVIASGFYFGWPIIYNNYIQPVSEHTRKISILETNAEESNTRISMVETQIIDISNTKPGIELTLGAINSKLEGLQASVDQHTNSIKSLEEIQTTIEKSNQSDKNIVNSKLGQMISMEYLSRARLFLYQSNFGLAKLDIQEARNTLANIDKISSSNGMITEVIQRLDLCLSRLPDYPVPASGDLDIAWQLLGSQNTPVFVPAATPIKTQLSPTDIPQTPTQDISNTSVPVIEITPTP